MASSGRRGGGDRVLESRHLVGLFLGVVILCGVFFTLGYVMGRTQYGGSVHAEAPLRAARRPRQLQQKTRKRTRQPQYRAAIKAGISTTRRPRVIISNRAAAVNSNGKQSTNNSAQATNQTNPSAQAPASAKTVPASAKQLSPSGFLPPIMAKNSIVVQVAAVKLQRDALEMADAIEQKKLPAFVAMAPADKLYHVQIGPYPDMASAESAKRQLEQLGFKPIIKR